MNAYSAWGVVPQLHEIRPRDGLIRSRMCRTFLPVKKKCVFLIACCLVCLEKISVAETFEVGPYTFHREVLPNGLTALALQSTNRTADVFLCVSAGKRQESSATTGLAHLTEHILFAGTKKIGGQAFERTIRKMGGKANAYTRNDYTLYYDVGIPIDRLNEVLGMEADRLRNLNFEPGAFKYEQERLIREEESDDRITEQLTELVDSIMFPGHPYEAGIREDGHTRAVNAKIQEVKAFYDAHYHPRYTAVMIVSMEPALVSIARIKQAFSALPAGPKRPEIELPEIPAVSVSKEFSTGLRQDRMEYVWAVPGPPNREYHVVQLLADMLGNRGRVFKPSISVGVGGRMDGDHLRVWATGVEAQMHLDAFFKELKVKPFTMDELELSRSELADDFTELGIHTRPYFSLPARVTQYHANGMPDFVSRFEGRLKSVSLEELNDSVEKWLDVKHRVVIHFKGAGKEIDFPKDRQGLARFASDAQEAGQHDDAIQAYTRLLEMKNNNMFEVIYLASRAQVAMDAKRYEEAIVDVKSAMKLSDYPALRPLLEEAEASRGHSF